MTKITASKGSRTERFGGRLSRSEKEMLDQVLKQTGSSLSDWLVLQAAKEVKPLENDKNLVDNLRNLLVDSERVRQSLYDRHPGCSCDRNGLCALHAQTYDYLWDSARFLRFAIKDIVREV